MNASFSSALLLCASFRTRKTKTGYKSKFFAKTSIWFIRVYKKILTEEDVENVEELLLAEI